MKKSVFSLLVIICLVLMQPVTTLAAGNYRTLDELRQEAFDGWHQSYEPHGRTIAIDISDISIPDAPQMPVYRVTSAGPIASDLLTGLNVVNNTSFLNIAAGNLWSETFKATYFDHKINEYFTADNAQWEMQTDGSEMTLQDAADFSEALIQRIYGDELAQTLQLETMHVLGKVYAINPKTHSFQEALTSIGSYTLHYRQCLGGVPIFQSDGPVFETSAKHEPYLDISCSIEIEVFLAQDYGLFGGLCVDDVLHEDIPLSPLSALIAVLEDEISIGRLRGIELGYLLYHDQASPDIGWAIPVWKCVAEYYTDESGAPYQLTESNGTVSMIPRTLPLYIPAQNPSLDLFSMDADRKVAPAVITWAQVQ